MAGFVEGGAIGSGAVTAWFPSVRGAGVAGVVEGETIGSGAVTAWFPSVRGAVAGVVEEAVSVLAAAAGVQLEGGVANFIEVPSRTLSRSELLAALRRSRAVCRAGIGVGAAGGGAACWEGVGWAMAILKAVGAPAPGGRGRGAMGASTVVGGCVCSRRKEDFEVRALFLSLSEETEEAGVSQAFWYTMG